MKVKHTWVGSCWDIQGRGYSGEGLLGYSGEGLLGYSAPLGSTLNFSHYEEGCTCSAVVTATVLLTRVPDSLPAGTYPVYQKCVLGLGRYIKKASSATLPFSSFVICPQGSSCAPNQPLAITVSPRAHLVHQGGVVEEHTRPPRDRSGTHPS